MAEQVRKNEKDCLMYIPYISPEDPSDIVIIEKYTDERAINLHMQTPYFKAAMEALKDVLAAPMEVQQFKA